MTDMTEYLPSYIESIKSYLSGAQKILGYKPPEEELLMETKRSSAYRHCHIGPPI